MSVQKVIPTTLNYQEYRFGRSRQIFRGPMPDLSKPYAAFIGGSETYGKFSPETYPSVLEQELSYQCINWGTPGAGPGFFIKDPVILEACSQAKICVISVMSAHTVPNRLYSTYLRRNEKFKEASEQLKTLYPEVDFSQFRFAANMVSRLEEVDETRFAMIRLEMKNAWIARMKELMTDIETQKILLWFSDLSPEESGSLPAREVRRRVPAFVSREMVEAVAPMADYYVEYVASEEAARGEVGDRIPGARGMHVARRFPSAMMHEEVAELLEAPLTKLLRIRR
ncbi:hypothetical protein FHS89_001327 [Rubricella aquisinus]|uniref:DUF6473 domain-containing protein n=1 Tax=Rubricella aquisinus TaxID=2028108 RepID=A0A840X3R5_9RHOB|nr:DUF6473 family protein [Rubricella aquisinus]MBB5515317.1 hypothetical protein [Rubricella aquisinus]